MSVPSTFQQPFTAFDHSRDTVSALPMRVLWTQDFLLENDTRLIAEVVQNLQDVAKAYLPQVDERWLMQFGVGIEEALSNSMVHGNLAITSQQREAASDKYLDLLNERASQPPYSNRRIQLWAAITEGAITVEIDDEGEGFDLEALPDPTEDLHLDRSHGRGLLMMRSFLDVVEYRKRGTHVRLVKRI